MNEPACTACKLALMKQILTDIYVLQKQNSKDYQKSRKEHKQEAYNTVIRVIKERMK